MAVPTITSIYPTDSSVGIPVSPTITITFDSDIDFSSCKGNVILYGRDFDYTSGPESTTWIDDDTGNNPYFLSSPGFSGTVPCDYELVYVDTTTGNEIDPQPDVYDETTVTYYHQLKITPKEILAPNVEYTLYIIGDSESGTSDAIQSRTVYDVDASAATSTDGSVVVYGGYTGSSDDTVNVEITTSGDIGTAKYKWWYTTEGVGAARTGKLCSSRYRRLEDGVQIKFSGSGFVSGDVYTFEVRQAEKFANSYSLSFTAGTGSIEEVPETASTSIIGSSTSLTSEATVMTVLDMDPDDGSTNQSLRDRRVTITFSNELDPDTVTDATITVTAYQVSGNFDTAYSGGEPQELVKKLTVNGDQLIIDL